MQRRMRVTAEIEKWAARLNAQVNSVRRSNPAASTPRWLLGQIGFWVARPILPQVPHDAAEPGGGRPQLSRCRDRDLRRGLFRS
jgi:hypothetical protein